jgi:hypothetical protein
MATDYWLAKLGIRNRCLRVRTTQPAVLRKTMRKKRVKDEQKLRDAFDRKRGSMEDWSADATPAKVAKAGGVVFSVRFTSEELQEIRRRAAALGTNISGLVRRAVLDESVHQPARVYSISLTRKPMLAVFGMVTEGHVTMTGRTGIQMYGGDAKIDTGGSRSFDSTMEPEQNLLLYLGATGTGPTKKAASFDSISPLPPFSQ